jgi:hypothetical protein
MITKPRQALHRLVHFSTGPESKSVSLAVIAATYQFLARDSAEPYGVDEFQRLLQAFQRDHGLIEDWFFCSNIRAGCVRTRRLTMELWRGRLIELQLHLTLPSDVRPPTWISELLLDCYRLQAEVRRTLLLTDKQINLEMIFLLITDLLEWVDVDRQSSHGGSGSIGQVGAATGQAQVPAQQQDAPTVQKTSTSATPPIGRQRRNNGHQRRSAPGRHRISRRQPQASQTTRTDDPVSSQRMYRRQFGYIQEYYQRSAQRKAQLIYFLGMIMGTLVVAFLALSFMGLRDSYGIDAVQVLFVCLASAVGAVVSVMQRITSGHLRLKFETGFWAILLLGSFRPIVGTVFGTVLYAVLSIGLLPITPPAGHENFFFGVVGFFSGFSERWAQDMLAAGQGQLAPAGSMSSATDLAGPRADSGQHVDEDKSESAVAHEPPFR